MYLHVARARLCHVARARSSSCYMMSDVYKLLKILDLARDDVEF